MALTPRVLIRNPLVLLSLTCGAFALFVVGSMLWNCNSAERAVVEFPDARECVDPPGACSQWTERQYVDNALCFQDEEDSVGAVRSASVGLNAYPLSEPLRNIKGYHEIVLDRHADAVVTLGGALDRGLEPSTGTLENNLAWALLWANQGGLDVEVLRHLYTRSMERGSASCETVHTALWVEYGAATGAASDSDLRRDALARYGKLRASYAACEMRNKKLDVAFEVVGVAVMDHSLAAIKVPTVVSPPELKASATSDEDSSADMNQLTTLQVEALRSRARMLFVRALRSYSANLPAGYELHQNPPALPCSEVPPVGLGQPACNAMLDAALDSPTVSAARSVTQELSCFGRTNNRHRVQEKVRF
jgi:hypothetical protein